MDGVETAYVYDMSADDPLAYDDITLEFTDGILTRRWAHSDAVDEPLGFEAYASQSGVGSGAEHAIYADRQGSVIWVTDPATGAVVAGYEYDAYGQITQVQGTLNQPYGYTGREYDAESGLYHYRARAYDPASGVFLQVDPIGFMAGTANLTGYVSQNPKNASDPNGQESLQFAGVTSIQASAGGAAVWSFGNATAAGVNRILDGLRVVRLLQSAKTTVAAMNTPQGQGDCKDPKSYAVHKRLRTGYKRLETMPLSCDGLTWNSSADIAERMRRARNGYQAAALRRLDMALCYRGGDQAHRDHAQRLEDVARKCMTK